MVFTQKDLEIVELPQREAMDKNSGITVLSGNRGNKTKVGVVAGILSIIGFKQ